MKSAQDVTLNEALQSGRLGVIEFTDQGPIIIYCILFGFQIKKLNYIRKLNKNYYWNVNGVGHKKNFKNRTIDFLDI